MIVDPWWILLLLFLLFLIFVLLYLLLKRAPQTPPPTVVLYNESSVHDCGADGLIFTNLAGPMTILVRVEREGQCGVVLSTKANKDFVQAVPGTPSPKIGVTTVNIATGDRITFKCDADDDQDPTHVCAFKITVTRIRPPRI